MTHTIRHPRDRAFTIIELMVALALGAVLTTAATATLLVARFAATESALKASMARDGQLVMDNIERDLAYLGAGVPKAANADTAGAAVGRSMLPVVRAGLTSNLVFIGDLPYPNAEVPGIAGLARVNGGAPSRTLTVTDEISGPCVPPANNAGAPCLTSNSTLVPGTYVAADDCDASQPTARTCPWGMRKWQNGSGGDTFLTFVDVAGNWYSRKVTGINAGTPVVAFEGRYTGVALTAGFPGGAGADNIDPTTFLGAGYVGNIDRVLYALEDPGAPGSACATSTCALYRRQCWGSVGDPTAAGFPTAGTSFVGTTSALSGCAAGTDGTGWETLATGISSFSFTYYQNTAALSAPLNAGDRTNVRAVEVNLTMTKKIPGQTRNAVVNMRRRFFLNNRESD